MTPLLGACTMQTPFHAALLVAAGIAAVAASASSSSCDTEPAVNHKVKHQDLKNSDPVAWARDSTSESSNHVVISPTSVVVTAFPSLRLHTYDLSNFNVFALFSLQNLLQV